MSEKSKKFWQDQISKKGDINVPDLLDDWANEVHGELASANTDLAAMLKEQVEENARLVDELKAMKAINPVSAQKVAQFCEEANLKCGFTQLYPMIGLHRTKDGKYGVIMGGVLCMINFETLTVTP